MILLYIVLFIVLSTMGLMIYQSSQREEQLKSKLLEYEDSKKEYVSCNIQVKKDNKDIQKTDSVLISKTVIYYELTYKEDNFTYNETKLKTKIQQVMKDDYDINVSLEDIKSAKKTPSLLKKN